MGDRRTRYRPRFSHPTNPVPRGLESLNSEPTLNSEFDCSTLISLPKVSCLYDILITLSSNDIRRRVINFYLIQINLILCQCLLFDIRSTTTISKQISNISSQVISKTTSQLDILPHVPQVHHTNFACDLHFHSNLQFTYTNIIMIWYN